MSNLDRVPELSASNGSCQTWLGEPQNVRFGTKPSLASLLDEWREKGNDFFLVFFIAPEKRHKSWSFSGHLELETSSLSVATCRHLQFIPTYNCIFSWGTQARRGASSKLYKDFAFKYLSSLRSPSAANSGLISQVLTLKLLTNFISVKPGEGGQFSSVSQTTRQTDPKVAIIKGVGAQKKVVESRANLTLHNMK